MAIVMAVYGVALSMGLETPEVRAMTFTTLVVANLGLILTNRSWTRTIRTTLRTPNKALWFVLGGAIVFLALVLYVPPLMRLFQFGRLSFLDIAIAVVAGAFSIAWFEGLKVIQGRRARIEV